MNRVRADPFSSASAISGLPMNAEHEFGARNQGRSGPEFRQVYFIEAPEVGLVKIGSADDATKRMTKLQIGSPLRLQLAGTFLANDAVKLEYRLHEQFAAQRVHGEWFKISDELRALMNTAAEVGADVRIALRPMQERPGDVTISRFEGEAAAAFAGRVGRVAITLSSNTAEVT